MSVMSRVYLLVSVATLCMYPLRVRGATLDHVSPLEMLSSVMGTPISLPDAMGGALENYRVASLPWEESSSRGTSSAPPTRRMVSFLPVEADQPLCTVDVRRQSASCVPLADSNLIPVLAGVETSIVDTDAPLIIVSRSTVALVSRDGRTLAARNLTALAFRNLTQFGKVWHVDFNASSGELIVYHHNSTALFADIVEVDLANASFRHGTSRAVYFASSVAFFAVFPNRLISFSVPCQREATDEALAIGWSNRLLRSASVLQQLSEITNCVSVIPMPTDGAISTACRGPMRSSSLCGANYGVITVGPHGSISSILCVLTPSHTAWDSYMTSTTALTTYYTGTRPPCYVYPFVTLHSPAQLFDGRECSDGHAMIRDVGEEYRLTTDFHRRAALLLDAQHGLGNIFAIVPLTCGSSQILLLRKQAATVTGINVAVVDFIPPPRFGHAISLVSRTTSLFVKPTLQPTVVACHAVACTLVDLDHGSLRSILDAQAVRDIVWNPDDEVMLAINTAGKGLVDGDVISSPGVPDIIVAVIFLPPLRIFLAIGSDKSGVHKICVIQPGIVTCNPVTGVSTIREWVWLPPRAAFVENQADVLIIGGNATFPTLFCYIRYTDTVDTVIAQSQLAPCRVLPLPVVVTSRQPRMVVHPWLPWIVECAATNATHVHIMMFNYAVDLTTPDAVTVQGDEEPIAVPAAQTAVTIVVRQFAAPGSVIGLVPLPIGTTLILTANGAMDLAVPRIVAPYVSTFSAVANTSWCTSYDSGGSTTISCVDLTTYDPYMVRCEMSASSRNALVYRGKPFSCQVYLAPFATAPAPIVSSSRQLLYNVSAEGVTITVAVTRVDFRGTVDLDFFATSFHVTYCVRPNGRWSCYRAVIDVANVDDLLMPWNSSASDRVTDLPPTPTTTRPSAPSTRSATTPTVESTTAVTESATTFPPAPTSITTRAASIFDALPPLASGIDTPTSAGNATLTSLVVTADVFRPIPSSSGVLRLLPANRSSTLGATAARVTIELTLSQPGIGVFVLDAGSNGVTVTRDAVLGLFTVSGPAAAVRDAIPWLRFGFSRSAAGRNDTTVTVALSADAGPRQTMVVRVSDIAEINTGPQAVSVEHPVTLIFAGRPFVALLPTTIVDADVRNESLWWSATLEGGAPLPDWLVFDPVVASVSGAVPVSTTREMVIRLTATDVFGLSASTMTLLKIDRAVLTTSSPRLPDIRVKPGQQCSALAPRDFVQRRSALSGDILGPAELARCSVWTQLASQEAEWLHAALSGGGALLSVAGGVPSSLPLGNVAMELRCYDDGILGAVRLPFTMVVANAAPRVVTGAVNSMLVVSASTATLSLRDAFADDDDEILDLRVVRTGGAPLPQWMAFDTVAGVLHCAPEAAVAGTSLSVVVTASDGRAFTSLTITVTVPPLVPPLPLPNASGTVIRVEVGTALSEYLSPRRFFVNATAIVRQSLAWPDRRSLDDPDLPVWLRFGDNILSGTPSMVGNVTLLLTGTDHTGAFATIPLRLEVYDTLMSIVLAWISYLGGFAGAVQAVAPIVLSYHLFFNVLFYSCVYTQRSPLHCDAGDRGDVKKRRYDYRAKHPTAADVRGFVRRPLSELPLPWAVVGGAVKLFSRYAYDLVTLHEMDNGDPAPPWLTIGHGEMAFSGAVLGKGEPDLVCVHITDSQGRLLEVFDVTYAPPSDDGDPGGASNHLAVDGMALLVEPLLPQSMSTKVRQDGRCGTPPPANPLRGSRPP